MLDNLVKAWYIRNMKEVESLSSRHFEAKDVRKLLGIDKNKLFYWMRTHRLLKPDIEEASGTGTRTKFSLKNLIELAIIKEIADFGLELAAVKKIKNRLDRQEYGYFTEDETIKFEKITGSPDRTDKEGVVDIYRRALEKRDPDDLGVGLSIRKYKNDYYVNIWEEFPEPGITKKDQKIESSFPKLDVYITGLAEVILEKIQAA